MHSLKNFNLKELKFCKLFALAYKAFSAYEPNRTPDKLCVHPEDVQNLLASVKSQAKPTEVRY